MSYKTYRNRSREDDLYPKLAKLRITETPAPLYSYQNREPISSGSSTEGPKQYKLDILRLPTRSTAPGAKYPNRRPLLRRESSSYTSRRRRLSASNNSIPTPNYRRQPVRVVRNLESREMDDYFNVGGFGDLDGVIDYLDRRARDEKRSPFRAEPRTMVRRPLGRETPEIISDRGFHRFSETCTCEHCREKYALPAGYDSEFEMVKQLGAGSFGAVGLLEVKHNGGRANGWGLRKGQFLVAKRIRPQSDHEPMFMQEWAALEAVGGLKTNENVIRGFAMRTPQGGDPWAHIFIEYCDMGNLQDLLESYMQYREKIPEGFLQQVFMEVAKGLDWMHHGLDKAWMHNDLKTDNVLMCSRRKGDKCIYPIFKIADLGAAGTMKTTADVFCLEYSSPQRLLDIGKPIKYVNDIFSLGVMIFYLAESGKFPYPDMVDDIKAQRIRKVADLRTEKRKMGHEYSRWFRNLIGDCIEFDEFRRPTTREIYYDIVRGRKSHSDHDLGGSRHPLWDAHWLR